MPGSATTATRRARTAAAALVACAAVVVVLFSLARVGLKCRDACYGRSARSDFGSLTFQPGHHWTRYADSWQWGAQNSLSYVAFLAAVLGVGLVLGHKRRAGSSLAVSALASTAWVVWIALSPSTTG